MRVYEPKYSKEFLESVVKNCTSSAQVMVELGLKRAGGNHRHLQILFKRFGIDTSHFKGRTWNKGETENSDVRVQRAIRQKYTDEEVFCVDSPITNTGNLRRRLLRRGWKYECSKVSNSRKCGLTEWFGQPIALHLDHINGVGDDNRYENLRFLCPNCHQQTDTWGMRKCARGEMADAPA